MSAIFGAISLEGQSIPQEVGKEMKAAYGKCRIDQYRELKQDDLYIGCGIQYYTKEAESEIMPLKDDKNHLIFAADCVLDNRDDLIEKLGIDDAKIPDGTLIYQSYLQWGKDCVNHLRGMFSFVVYDWEKREVTLFADHFATRCLFYHVRDNVLYFSTLLMPMIKASGLKYKLNMQWLVDSISVLTPAMMFDTRTCAYQDVFKVDSGNMLFFKRGKKPVYERYYDPENEIKTDYSITDEQCKKELYDTLFRSVKNCIRTSGEVGIQLSSGLDSSTIGCIAAPYLKEQDKKLYSYTSVPLKDSPKDKSKYYVDDETEGVMKIVEAYPNIIPAFLECEGKNILNQGERILEIWELPCQSHQNAVWIDDIFKTAGEQGCRIMLSGATGNCTVSAGDYVDTMMYHVHRGHPIRGLKDFKAYCQRYRLPAKKVLKSVLVAYKDYLKLKFHLSDYEYKEFSLTKTELLKEYRFDARVAKKELLSKPWSDMKRYRECIYLKKAYAQIGEVDTKISLRYGVLPRDPLRNVEFINFCMKLPMTCFANGKYARRLVREFMQGIVPKEICMDVGHRGRQSGDNTYRISKEWEQYQPVIKENLFSQIGLTFFDENKIHQKLDHLSKDNLEDNTFDMRNCIDGALFVKYVDNLMTYT